MGIRINKVLGYGLTNVISNKTRWDYGDDPRFNKNSYLFNEIDEKYSIDGFIEYLKNRVEEMGDDFPRFELRLLMRDLEDDEQRYDFCESIVHDMEMGLDNVVCFIPPSQIRSWKRYDNIIDYYDPMNRSEDGGIKESLIMLDRALYPWESYSNIKDQPPTILTGTKLSHYYSLKNHGFDKLVKPEAAFESLGVDNLEELKTMIAPTIPLELVELLKYLEIFVDETCIYQLRPMIYGWWA